jgi:hypothetical protein
MFGDLGFSLAPNLSARQALSWSSPNALQKIEKNGNYHLYFERNKTLSLVVDLPKPLHLNASISFSRLIIEPRLSTRFDRSLWSLQSPEHKARFSRIVEEQAIGAFLYLRGDGSDASTVLIDAHPNTYPKDAHGFSKASLFAELADSKLLPGQSFKVFDSPITLKVLRATPSSLTLNVEGLSP